MVLDLPGGLFGQDDVRETETGERGEISYWTCAGTNFSAVNPDVNDVAYDTAGRLVMSADGIVCFAPVFLPHGAVITAVVLTGSISDETWVFEREPIGGVGGDIIANTSINTEDITISNGTVDNSAYRYFIYTSSLDTGDQIYGVRITYTT